ncbi:tryptophan synthase beta subunit-like PLP-dependent enzyme [Lipomyces oligophaga]|uniref:tryptophan synthase beta subunit-like PLP-dependent enzyme n=1 Tax=Lipomyces oligophaga TaxID=45792 RepID=UPI0034CDD9D5
MPINLSQNPYIETPLIHSSYISRKLGCNVALKLDLLQPSGSFKSRGLGTLIRHHISDKTAEFKFVSSSGGNAGLAVAEACQRYGVECIVVVPEPTPQAVVDRLSSYEGTRVEKHGSEWKYADARARQIVAELGDHAVYCSPFDDPLIWQGNSSLVDEIVAQAASLYPCSQLKAISCSVGGGGLYTGLASGLSAKYDSIESRPMIVTSETVGANKLVLSLQQGKLVTLDKITSIASSLGAPRVADQAWHFVNSYPTLAAQVTDSEAVMACLELLRHHRLLVEPACGAAIAVWDSPDRVKSAGISDSSDLIVIVICGGSTVTIERLLEFSHKFGL